MNWEPERSAAAYLSRITMGPSQAVSAFVADHGYVDAAKLIRSGTVPTAVADRLTARAHIDTVDEDARVMNLLGGRLVIRSDTEWPAQLARSSSSSDNAAEPVALWVIGRPLDTLTENAIALVGSRAATAYGEHVTSEIAGDLAGDGITITSDAAFGIGGAAARAAMGVGGTAAAVLACGVDRAYPAGHARLLQRIAETGAVISEYAPGTAPAKHRFVQRNRLLSGLSQGVVVVEAGWRSGSQNTASWARSLGRPVMAVPGPITSAASSGCHRMIREGEAVLVTSAREVSDTLNHSSTRALSVATTDS